MAKNLLQGTVRTLAQTQVGRACRAQQERRKVPRGNRIDQGGNAPPLLRGRERLGEDVRGLQVGDHIGDHAFGFLESLVEPFFPRHNKTIKA